jgi:lipopolysaccharide export system protein LptA
MINQGGVITVLRTFRISIYSLCLLALALATATAATEGGPIHVEADRMESDQQGGAVIFVGNVEARQGEMLITGDRMTVNYQKNDNSDSQSKNIESLVASGNIKLTRQDWIATGDQLEYRSEERKVVLTGNTKVWQDNNMVSGERVVLYLDEGRSVVEKTDETEKGRVKAFFYPEANKNETNN